MFALNYTDDILMFIQSTDAIHAELAEFLT